MIKCVKLEDLVFAIDPDDPKRDFFNPRLCAGAKHIRGFLAETIKNLSLNIRDQGLLQPIICRPDSCIGWDGKDSLPHHNSKFQIVDGERRKRALDLLIHDNAVCFCPNSRKYIPARELYVELMCDVRDLTDEEAWQVAYSTNDEREEIGLAAICGIVLRHRNAGWDTKKILSFLGKKWTAAKLGQIDTINGLDKKTFNAVVTGDVTISVGVKLAEEKDKEVRHQMLAETIAHAKRRQFVQKVQIQDEVEHVEGKIELHEAQLELAEEFEDDPEVIEEGKKKAKNKLGHLEEVKEDLEEKLEEISHEKPKALPKDLPSVKPNPLTFKKVKSHWLKAIDELIAHPIAAIPERDVVLVHAIINAMEEGEEDIKEVLYAHATKAL